MITFTEKGKGITVLVIENKAARAEISLYGGNVLSWSPTGEKEVLFKSAKSFFEPGKTIRGGIPVCFPWFGPNQADPKSPPHGFARTSLWRLASVCETPKDTTVILELESNAETKAKWPHEFILTLEVSIGKKLAVTLTTANTGKADFGVTTALHTYFSIGDIKKTSVGGFDKCAYIDRIGEKTIRQQTGDVRISGETDRVYLSGKKCTINDNKKERTIIIESDSFPDTVIWNPWIEKAKAIVDLEDDEYRRFICVEAGSVLENVIMVKGDSSVSQTMTLSLA